MPIGTSSWHAYDLVDRSARDGRGPDETVHASLSAADVYFTCTPNSPQQPQAHAYWPLLTVERSWVYDKSEGAWHLYRPARWSVGRPAWPQHRAHGHQPWMRLAFCGEL